MTKMRIAVLLCAISGLSVGVSTAVGGNSENAKMCQHNGWQTLKTSTGSSFANQGACVSYGAHGGTFVTETQSQRDCESFGGTFVTGTTPVIWTCVSWTNSGAADYNAKFTTMANDCFDDIVNAFGSFGIIGPLNVPGAVSTVCELRQQ